MAAQVMDLSLNSVGTDGTDSNSSPMTTQNLVLQYMAGSCCYDLMQASSKGTIFETTIPFQLAFLALIEHDTDVAPLWDPESRAFVGLMVLQDYITCVRILTNGQMPMDVLMKPIRDLLSMQGLFSQQGGFLSLDVSSSPLTLYHLLLSSRNDYVPLLDEGKLVGILGVLDVLHLLTLIPQPAALLAHCNVGCYSNIITTTRHAPVSDVLNTLHTHSLSALPVVDEVGRVQGMYHKSDVAFVIKSSDAAAGLQMKIEHVLMVKEQLLASGELISNTQGLVTAKKTDTLQTLMALMVSHRSHRVVIVDEHRVVKGIVSAKDIISYYLDSSSNGVGAAV